MDWMAVGIESCRKPWVAEYIKTFGPAWVDCPYTNEERKEIKRVEANLDVEGFMAAGGLMM